MIDPAKEQAYREEAERLKLLPVDVQQQILDMDRAAARTLKRKADREVAKRRAAALSRLLQLPAKKRKKPLQGS